MTNTRVFLILCIMAYGCGQNGVQLCVGQVASGGLGNENSSAIAIQPRVSPEDEAGLETGDYPRELNITCQSRLANITEEADTNVTKAFCNGSSQEDCLSLQEDNEGDDQMTDFQETVDAVQTYSNLVIRPSIAVFGCVCNIFNVFILTRKSMRNSFNNYLLALSLADLAFLLVALVRWAFWLLGWVNTALYQKTVLSFNLFVFDNLMNLGTGRLSNMLVLLLSIERFVAVRFPLKAKLSPLHRHSWKVILLTTVLVFAILIPNQFSRKMVVRFNPSTNESVILYQKTDFSTENADIYGAYVYCILFILRFVPVFFVVVFNMAIIITLSLYSRKSIRSTSTNQSSRDTEQLKLTKMLIALAIMFLLCVSPGFVHSVISNFHPHYNSGGKYHTLWALFYTIFTILDLVNSTFNFFVYLMMSTQFRAIFFNTFGCSRKELTSKNHSELPSTTLETERDGI